MCYLGANANPEVCIIRASDGKRFDIAEVSYDYGGQRLDIDPESHTLFTGAYHRTGVAAYDIESGTPLWERRDIKKLGEIAYDAVEGILYCLCERRAVLLTASTGKEYAYYRNLNDVFFGGNVGWAVFDVGEVQLLNRATEEVRILPKATGNILTVAFTESAAVLSWVGGPVTAHDLASGQLVWNYEPEGTHAYAIAPASDNASVWVAEQPYKQPPWHRLRRLSSAGELQQEVRCALGHSFEIAPYADSVIRGNLALTPIGELGDG
jgi:outer membrane protein assembly factor BamB